jgi:hypothetical protein
MKLAKNFVFAIAILGSTQAVAQSELDGTYQIDFDSSELFSSKLEAGINDLAGIRSQIAAGQALDGSLLSFLTEIGLYVDGSIVEEQLAAELLKSHLQTRMTNESDYNVTKIEIVGGNFDYFPAETNHTFPKRNCRIQELNKPGGLICPREGFADQVGIVKVEKVGGTERIYVKLTDMLETVFVKE